MVVSFAMVTPLETIGFTQSLSVPRVLPFALKNGTALRAIAKMSNHFRGQVVIQECKVPEFHIGDATIAKPKPARSKASFKPSGSSSIGAKVEAKPPMSVLICPSALLIASYMS